MIMEIAKGVTVPFLGTSLGAMCVFFLKNELNKGMQKVLAGFAAGVMTAASIWSLLLPSIEQAESMGRWKFVPAAVGFFLGILLLVLIDYFTHVLQEEQTSVNQPDQIPVLQPDQASAGQAEHNPAGQAERTESHSKLMLAVTLHNIPEGMAVGVIYAGLLKNVGTITAIGAFSLAVGIAIQNFPEGAIISMPLRAQGLSKKKAFLMGVLSGAVEPVCSVFTIWASAMIVPLLPWMLSFAAGAMLYVVVEELIPQMSGLCDTFDRKKVNTGILFFTAGFTLMMILDVILG